MHQTKTSLWLVIREVDLASAIDPGWPLTEGKRGSDLPPGGKAGGAEHLKKRIIYLRQTKAGGAQHLKKQIICLRQTKAGGTQQLDRIAVSLFVEFDK